MEHDRPGGRVRRNGVTAADPGHTGAVFSADPTAVEWFSGRILEACRETSPARVLEIGSGDGSLLASLARHLPRASFLGVDLSDANCAAATRAIAATPDHNRIAFLQADYMSVDVGHFDLVVAYSSLQGIDATTGELTRKLAHDTAAGGRIVHATPYRCAYNSALNGVRAALRQVRGGATDHMILMVARLLHPDQPDGMLRERVDYMYLVLRHYEDDLRAALQARGFHLETADNAPHTSVGQPKHRLAVMSSLSRIDH